MPQKRMECFRLLLGHLAWIEHQFLSGIRDSRKAWSLWGMMRGVRGVRMSIHQSWLAKGLGLGLLCWGFKGVQEEIPSEEASILQIGTVTFPAGQCSSPQLHPCHRLFEQDGHQDISSASHSPDLAPCDFSLFPKVRGCRRYETIEEMKEAMTKVIYTLTEEDIHETFQKLLERYNKHLIESYLWVKKNCLKFKLCPNKYVEGERKLWIQTCETPLNIDLVSHPARAKGLVNIYSHKK